MVEDILSVLDQAATFLGGGVVGLFTLVAEAGAQMASDPKALARDIIIQLIMFALTTIALGSLYHYLVLVPAEAKATKERETRRAALLGPFRRMLVMRIASTHSTLFAAITKHEDWSGNWGRPRVRSFVGAIAGLNADFASAVLTNQELLQPDEQKAIGRYSELLFSLQKQFESIEGSLSNLSMAEVINLSAIIEEANSSVGAIAVAFEEVYQTQIQDLLWDEEDSQVITACLIAPLEKRATTIATPRVSPVPVPVPASPPPPTFAKAATAAPTQAVPRAASPTDGLMASRLRARLMAPIMQNTKSPPAGRPEVVQ